MLIVTGPGICRVTITARAKQDLRALLRWLAQHDAPGAAEHVLDQLLETCNQLALQPERGACPAKLVALGIRRYRQVLFKPYSVIYRADIEPVSVLLIADGRRSLKTLLERRLLGR